MNESNAPIPALCRALPEGDGPPGWLLLVPAGRFEGRDGRFWVNDRPDAIVAAFEAAGQPLPIDWEHATEIKAPAGDPAPAAGWITALCRYAIARQAILKAYWQGLQQAAEGN